MDKNQKKRWYKKWWVWVLVVFVLIGIGGASSGSKSTNSTANTSNGSSQSETKPDGKTEFKIGEAATFDDKSITVTNIERNYDTGNQFLKPESGKEFVIVTVNIVNNGSSALDYNTYEFKMQDSNGVQQSEALTALSEGKLNSGSLAKGGTVTGKLAYEVPKGDVGLKLLYQGLSFFSNKTITFTLQ